jgi:hypothetical protein
MATKAQKTGKTRQVRIREDKCQRVEKIVVEEIGRRKVALDNIDIYDEILEEGLSKRERKLGLV